MNGMLDTLAVEHFKCFENLRLPLKPLTLFTGFNGAGKSTALQPLLLLAQAARLGAWGSKGKTGKLPLNGEVVRLGSAGDVLRSSRGDRATRFALASGDDDLQVTVSAKAGDRVLSTVTTASEGGASELSRRIDRLVHISAVRRGPADSFPIPDRSYSGQADVGVDGRYASHWYHELADEEVRVEARCPGSIGTTFRRQVDAWLDFLAPSAAADVQAVPTASSLVLRFRLSEVGEWKRPANVGYGLTYVFPIVVALLAAEPGDVVVIDSPEAHLHPQAQSRVGRMLACFATAGVQLLVETHSDHVLNGIRLSVAEGVLPPADAGLTFFAGASEAGHGVTTPQVDRHGRINSWPAGFFDQSDNDVGKLAGWS